MEFVTLNEDAVPLGGSHIPQTVPFSPVKRSHCLAQSGPRWSSPDPDIDDSPQLKALIPHPTQSLGYNDLQETWAHTELAK